MSFRMKYAFLILVSILLFAGCTPATTGFEEENTLPAVQDGSFQNSGGDIPDSTPKAGTTNQVPVTLVSVTDGDTIRIMYKGVNEPVRYLLIDTPETNHPRLGKQPFGDEAKERNRELVNSGNLSIEFDVGEKRDKYGRLLAYVYVDGVSLQETLVREGLARVAYVYPPNTRHLAPYEKAQEQAKSKKIGIWSVEDYATDSGFSSPDTSVPDETPSTTKETFKNCTHLRTKYPNGVSSSHPAYKSGMDGDKDNFACER